MFFLFLLQWRLIQLTNNMTAAFQITCMHLYVHTHSQKCTRSECETIWICTYSLATMLLAVELPLSRNWLLGPPSKASIQLILTIRKALTVNAPHWRTCTNRGEGGTGVEHSIYGNRKHKVCYLEVFCFLLLWIVKFRSRLVASKYSHFSPVPTHLPRQF